MKKQLLIILIILVSFTMLLSFGSVLLTGKFELQLQHDGQEMLCKRYKIKVSTIMTVLVRYAGNFHQYYVKNKEEERIKELSCLNDEIAKDIKQVVDIIEEPMIDSEIVWDKNEAEFSYKAGKNGISVIRQELIERIYREMGTTIKIRLPIEEIKQEIDINDLKMQTKERASFSTVYASSSSNRKHNIALAAKRLHGQVIPAKSEFSFNKTVGPRTVDNGFKVAGIISGGAFVQGVGGGVCQVSTTLFNAWIYAGLEAINAVNHSLPVSYIGPSFDAMVSSRNDLLLFNNTSYDIYLKCKTKENKITITVYGLNTEEKVVLRNEIIKTIYCNEYNIIEDIQIDWGENEYFRVLKQPKNGLVSVAYKDIYIKGKLVRTEKLRTNTYAPQKGRMVRKPVIKNEEENEKNEA